MNINSKWELLETEGIESGFKTIRFEAEGPLEIFLAVDELKLRSILIYLPANFKPQFEAINNDNIEITSISEGHYLQIRLIDSEFKFLFDDLIASLIQSIKHISDPAEASKGFVSTYLKWNSFFTKTSEKKLSDEKVMGLWGELEYLKSIIDDSLTSIAIDKILRYWVGPYDAAQDFDLPEKLVEIKTKRLTSVSVKISSEFQLENIDDKGIHLAVISVVDSDAGSSLLDQFTSIKESILKNNGDITLLLTALEKEGLNEQRLEKYSHLKFLKKKVEIYDCELEGFPKLSRSSLPDPISTVSYNLDIRNLSEYQVFQEMY